MIQMMAMGMMTTPKYSNGEVEAGFTFMLKGSQGVWCLCPLWSKYVNVGLMLKLPGLRGIILKKNDML